MRSTKPLPSASRPSGLGAATALKPETPPLAGRTRPIAGAGVVKPTSAIRVLPPSLAAAAVVHASARPPQPPPPPSPLPPPPPLRSREQDIARSIDYLRVLAGDKAKLAPDAPIAAPPFVPFAGSGQSIGKPSKVAVPRPAADSAVAAADREKRALAARARFALANVAVE